MVEVHEQYSERGVAFLGIAVEDNSELVQDFARAYGIKYSLVTGKEQGVALMQKLGNRLAGLPFTLVLDARGNIVADRRGKMSAARLTEALESALAEPEQASADTR